MDQETQAQFDALNKRMDDIYVSVEKARKYFLWTLIITVATVVLPLIALAFILPWFVKTMSSAYGI